MTKCETCGFENEYGRNTCAGCGALMNVGVHQTHCCDIHGCKYGDDDCPVAYGNVKQDYPCETCGLDWEGFYSAEDPYRETGPAQLTLRPDTKKLVEKLMKTTGTNDPETVINGALTFLANGFEELERIRDARKSEV